MALVDSVVRVRINRRVITEVLKRVAQRGAEALEPTWIERVGISNGSPAVENRAVTQHLVVEQEPVEWVLIAKAGIAGVHVAYRKEAT